jgi:hypothetical protein
MLRFWFFSSRSQTAYVTGSQAAEQRPYHPSFVSDNLNVVSLIGSGWSARANLAAVYSKRIDSNVLVRRIQEMRTIKRKRKRRSISHRFLRPGYPSSPQAWRRSDHQLWRRVQLQLMNTLGGQDESLKTYTTLRSLMEAAQASCSGVVLAGSRSHSHFRRAVSH